MSTDAGQVKRTLLIGCALLERELRHLTAGIESIELRLVEQGLHERPESLCVRLQQEIDRADVEASADTEASYDFILIAYGLCSNGLAGIRARRVPLLVPRAHDCITLLLGSRACYRDYFDRNPGTYWYSIGWLETGSPPGPDYFERKRKVFMEQYEDEDTVDYLLAEESRWITNYHSACFIRQDLEDDTEAIARTRSAAAAFGWTFDTLPGDLGLLRDLVQGRVDSERLLLVPPGSGVAPSYDESIVRLADA